MRYYFFAYFTGISWKKKKKWCMCSINVEFVFISFKYYTQRKWRIWFLYPLNIFRFFLLKRTGFSLFNKLLQTRYYVLLKFKIKVLLQIDIPYNRNFKYFYINVMTNKLLICLIFFLSYFSTPIGTVMIIISVKFVQHL